jgi:hypothetical protein
MLLISVHGEFCSFFSKGGSLTWFIYRSFTMGYGLPPKEKLSVLVISILAIGLGIPVLLLVGSGIFLICKKCTRSRDEPLLE